MSNTQQGSVLHLMTNNQTGASSGQEQYLISQAASPFSRHFQKTTNHAIEVHRLHFQGGGAISNGQGTVDIQKTADLLGSVYLTIDAPGLVNVGEDANGESKESDKVRPSWCNGVGFRIVKEASIRIGQQTIETVFSEQLYMYMLLNGQVSKMLQGKAGWVTNQAERQKASLRLQRFHVQLPFSLGSHPSMYLPVCAIQFHHTQLQVTFNTNIESLIENYNEDDDDNNISKVKTVIRKGQANMEEALAASAKLEDVDGNEPEITASHVTAAVEADMVLLDGQERTEMAAGFFEMVFTQTQRGYTRDKSNKNESIELPFNNSVVEILFAARMASNVTSKDYFNFGGYKCPTADAVQPIIKQARLTLNNHTRVEHPEDWFRTVHAASVGHNTQERGSYVYPYSFAMRPADAALQFSGGINFSKLDNKKLDLTLESEALAAGNVEILTFGTTYNVLTIYKGVAGVKYA